MPQGRSNVASHLPDELLARRAAAGRLEEFEELLRRYRHRAYRICYRMAGNGEDAEDWAQECFVLVYRQLHTCRPDAPVAPWCLRVVSNTCINLAKTRTSRQSRIMLGLGEEEESFVSDFDPLKNTLSDESAREVRAAVAALPPT